MTVNFYDFPKMVFLFFYYYWIKLYLFSKLRHYLFFFIDCIREIHLWQGIWVQIFISPSLAWKKNCSQCSIAPEGPLLPMLPMLRYYNCCNWFNLQQAMFYVIHNPPKKSFLVNYKLVNSSFLAFHKCFVLKERAGFPTLKQIQFFCLFDFPDDWSEFFSSSISFLS